MEPAKVLSIVVGLCLEHCPVLFEGHAEFLRLADTGFPGQHQGIAGRAGTHCIPA
jgi:hypothetical protein